MWSLLKQVLKFLWRRDSEQASGLCIDLAEHLTDRDLRNMAQYFDSVREWRRAQPVEGSDA